MTDNAGLSDGAASAQAVAGALDKMRTMLAADGYSLVVAVDDGEITLEIAAGPEACEECLVPKEVLGAIAADLLAKGGIDVPASALRLRYPVEHGV